MSLLSDQIRQALRALAGADLGERVGRRERYAALSSMSADPVCSSAEATPPVAVRKWIALGVGETLPAPVMAYAIGACRRMQAGLLLLACDALRARSLLAAYLPELQGIDCLTEEIACASPVAVVHALNRHRGVLFAVSGSQDDPLESLLRARRRLRAPVPVVMVSRKSAQKGDAQRGAP